MQSNKLRQRDLIRHLTGAIFQNHEESILFFSSNFGTELLADGAMARVCIVERRGSQISALIGLSCNSNCVAGSPVHFERVGALVSLVGKPSAQLLVVWVHDIG